MEYFILVPDQMCPIVRICNHTDPRILQAVMRGEAGRIPDGTVFQLKEVPGSGMPDVLFRPVLLVSELFFKCIQIYHPYVTAARIRLVHRRDGYTYYIPELPSWDGAGASPLYEQHIYGTTDDGVGTVRISLDLSESLLRRGAWGFGLKEGE